MRFLSTITLSLVVVLVAGALLTGFLPIAPSSQRMEQTVPDDQIPR